MGQKRWMCDMRLLCKHEDLPGSSQHLLRKHVGLWPLLPCFVCGRDRRIAPGMIEQDSRDPPLILVCTNHACPVHMHLHKHTCVCVY